LFYIFGDQSVTLSNELADLASETEKGEHITRFFKPYYSLLPHFSEGSKDCTPISCVATSWATDELAGYGSYSTFQTGLKAVDKDIEVLREGLHKRSLWFAGEHNGPFIAMGTVTSAYVCFPSTILIEKKLSDSICSGVARLLGRGSQRPTER
jgi:hypothetical protein